MKRLLLILLFMSFPVQADPAGDLKPVGDSEMKWMLWKLYDIRLLSTDGNYRENGYPLALSIRYARNIDADRLVSATLDEWRRMDIDWKRDWQHQLERIWPSVKPGDELLLLVTENSSSRFYFNQRLIGEITDAGFAAAFLSIWLSTNTREPEMREQLIGGPNA